MRSLENLLARLLLCPGPMTRLRSVCVALVTLVTACAAAPVDEIAPFIDTSTSDGKADGHSIKLLKLDRRRLDVAEPSDLTMVNGALYTISDAHSQIYEVSPAGDRLSSLDIQGRDLEALGFDQDRGQFLVADESRARIWHIDPDGSRHDPIELPDAEDGNSGIEGLTFGANGHLFVAKEKDPARIFELGADGSEIQRTRIDFASDLSALTFNPEDGHLYALSDEEHTLYRLEHDLDVDRAWRLPIEHPEGIAFDGPILYVVSDSEERIYMFAML
ncbi:MAG: hypothetical protein H6Q90_1259 [Deltaproteobacteria bacterium]|nr:hypothetical protein [Deltaproteobacteria bacterium]